MEKKPKKVVKRVVKRMKDRIKDDPRVQEVINLKGRGDGIYIHLKYGFRDGTCPASQNRHIIHQDNISDCLRFMQWVEPCFCGKCFTAKVQEQEQVEVPLEHRPVGDVWQDGWRWKVRFPYGFLTYETKAEAEKVSRFITHKEGK